MTSSNDAERQSALQRITAALARHAQAAPAGDAAPATPQDWLDAGFDDPEEVEEWLSARCFSPAGASALERAGITPEQAAFRTRGGEPDYEETIGFKLSRGHLSPEEARRIVTNDFWNS